MTTPDPPVAVPGPASEPADPVVSPAATPGPKEIIEMGRYRIRTWCKYAHSDVVVADLEALADLAAALLAVGERDKAEIERLRRVLDRTEDEWEREGERDRQQIARLTEALRFYADKSKWNYRIGGKQARATYVSYRLAEEALRDVAVLAGEEDARTTKSGADYSGTAALPERSTMRKEREEQARAAGEEDT